jgi:hypothetical protein
VFGRSIWTRKNNHERNGPHDAGRDAVFLMDANSYDTGALKYVNERVHSKGHNKMPKKREQLRGKALVAAAMNTILAKPELWNQRQETQRTQCGTAHCFCGWILFLGTGKDPQKVSPFIETLESLTGFKGEDQWWWAFGTGNTVRQLYGFARAIVLGRKPSYKPWRRKMTKLRVPARPRKRHEA